MCPGSRRGAKRATSSARSCAPAVLKLMDTAQLDALVYPTWSNPPRLIGDLNTPGGDNSQLFSPSTGFPAITVPMGYTRGDTLPAGLQFFGRPWSEPTLLRLAYAYEQATHHRRPPQDVAAARTDDSRDRGGPARSPDRSRSARRAACRVQLFA